MKFRIWLKGLERFATDEWYLDPEGRVYFENIMDGVLERASENSYVVQRSTGLLDKNGVEIYEGDLLKFNKDVFICKYFKDRATWIVEFEDGAMWYYLSEIKCEIVGHIFDK